MLRRQFLPNPFNPLGQYPNRNEVNAYTRAFVVLSHAEVETYLEGWAKDIARKAEDIWYTSRRITEPLAFLLASLSERIAAPRSLIGGERDSHEQLGASLKKVFQKYYKQVRDNNGVKEGNLLALFSPIGVPRSATSSTLLPMLSSFGASRGVEAHQSAQAVINLLDPETEFNNVTNLAKELLGFDKWLREYRRRIR